MLRARIGVRMEHVGNPRNDQLLYERVMFYIEPILSSKSEKGGSQDIRTHKVAYLLRCSIEIHDTRIYL